MSVRGGEGKKTVYRYTIPDRRRYSDDNEVDVKIIRKTSDRSYDDRDYRFEREREVDVDTPRREYRTTTRRVVEERSSSPELEREVRRTREVIRERPPEYTERYTRDIEYLRDNDRVQPIIIRQDAPQPIIIREQAQQPIVIREQIRDNNRYELVESRQRQSQDDDNRSVTTHRSKAKSRRQSSPSPDSNDQEEDYYYTKRTRQIARRPQAEYEAQYRREVDPRDSASNWGGDDRRDDRRYSDEEVYYRRTEDYDSDGGSRDRSPHHKRHIAEGAVLGLGAAALLRNHNKKTGKPAGGAGRLVGGAALGALGAEAVTRGAQAWRARSKSRGRDYRRDDSRSRSRSRSGGPVSGLVKLGAVAAIGALAGYAATRGNRANREAGGGSRSQSRGRPSSRSPGPTDPKHQRATIAKAGLATAAIAGLVDRARSKSRPNRSRSKGRALLPIVGAGLGGAALAGLYERQKAKKVAAAEGPRGRSPTRSRSRSRSVNPNGGNPGAGDDQNLVVYGAGAPPDGGYAARPRSRAESFYSQPGERRRGSVSDDSDSPRRRRGESRRRRRAEDDAGPAAWGPYAEPIPPTGADPNPGMPYSPPNQYNQNPHYNNFSPPPNAGYQPPTSDNSYQAYNPNQHPGHGGVTQATQNQWYPAPTGHDPPSNYPGGNDPNRRYNVSDSPPQGERDLGSATRVMSPDIVESPIEMRPNEMSSDAPITAPNERVAPADRYKPPRRKSVSFDPTMDSIHDIPAPAPQDQSRSTERADQDDRNSNSRNNVGSRNDDNDTMQRSTPTSRNQRGTNRHNNEPRNDDQSRRERITRPSRNDRTPGTARPDERRARVDTTRPTTRRTRSAEPTTPTAGTSTRNRSRRSHRQEQSHSDPEDNATTVSDSVEELPPRFDKDGKRIPVRGEDPLADAVEDFLHGRGLNLQGLGASGGSGGGLGGLLWNLGLGGQAQGGGGGRGGRGERRGGGRDDRRDDGRRRR